MKSVKEHCEQKELPLNVKKTEIVDIEKWRREATIKIYGEEIKRANSFEYLGAMYQDRSKL